MTIRLSDCIISATPWRTRWLRRRRWNVTVHHVPSDIIGHGLGARSYEEARDGAIRRVESLLQTRRDRP